MNEEIMRAAGFGTQVDLVKAGKCPWCRKDVKEEDFTDKEPIFLREFKISGICYTCQNGFFINEEDEGKNN